ncbi:hypothetical protein L6164_029350 [Bauhinia variegata]|uniref:Uncharacterized protein n=1 Tax=Bauhinia variegata TaxID=167791 RepID=A0ACB9L922_BAUVA|nr:hypothetical protein L6164_029350 [Bauhinia variegata]
MPEEPCSGDQPAFALRARAFNFSLLSLTSGLIRGIGKLVKLCNDLSLQKVEAVSFSKLWIRLSRRLKFYIYMHDDMQNVMQMLWEPIE